VPAAAVASPDAGEGDAREMDIGVPQSQHPPGVQKGEPEMSSEPGPIRPSAEPRAESMGRAEEEAGSGWVLFAGVMMMVAGVMNCIYGIAAIADPASTSPTPGSCSAI